MKGHDSWGLAQSPLRYLFKNAGIISLLSGAGVASGLVLDALILAVFGVGVQTDAYLAALALPLLVVNTLAIQGPKILIPVFTQSLVEDGRETAWGLLRNLITTGAAALTAVAAAGMLLAGLLIPAQIPGLEDPVISLATQLNRWLFLLVPLQGTAVILQSALFAEHRYLASSVGKLVINCLALIAAASFYRSMGIQSVALGMIAGSVAQFALMYLALAQRGFRYNWFFDARDPRLRNALRSFKYPLAGNAVAETRVLLENFLGSFLGGGSLTVLRYASRIVTAVSGVLMGSIIQAAFPLVAHHAAAGDRAQIRKAILQSVKLLALAGLPISIWLALMAQPLLVLLFERAEFTRSDAALTGVLVALMAPYVFLSRLIGVAQTPFYSVLEMRPPWHSTLIFFAVNMASALLLLKPWGIYSLPIALSLASSSGAAFMVVQLNRRFGPLGWSSLKGFAWRLAAAGLVSALGFFLGGHLAGWIAAQGLTQKVLDLAVPSSLGLGAFAAMALALRLVDLRALRTSAGQALVEREASTL